MFPSKLYISPLLCIVGLGIPIASGSAQIVVPEVTYDGPRNTSIPALATQAWMNVALENVRTRSGLSVIDGHYPKDSLVQLVVDRAKGWLDKLQASSVKGLQLTPYGMLALMANQETAAREQISKRLAEKGLALQDRAMTLQIAVSIFADPEFPERVQVAEQYLKELDSLGTAAAFWQFNARKSLIYSYYRLGKSPDIVRLGEQMVSLVDDIPFELRHLPNGMYTVDMAFYYGAIVDALSGQSGGRDVIRKLNSQLMAATSPPPDLVAHDSSFAWKGESNRQVMKNMVDMSERVGQAGTPIFANYWLNRGAARDSQTVNVSDGKIRIIEIGSFTCGPCMSAVPSLNRLSERYPNVDFSFLTSTLGVWGNRVVESEVEAERLANHFLTNIKAKIPVGIAFTKRESTSEGLVVGKVATRTWDGDQYPQSGTPTFYILDGKGTIRRVLCGYNRDFEENLAGIIEFLQRESTN